MTIRNFEHLLAPRSVALIGASNRPASVGLITACNLLQGGFAGPIWFVNPKHETIEGQPCYPSIERLPAAPDLAVIVTPPATVPGLIAALSSCGTRAAVVITAGLRGELKAKMLEASRSNLLRIQGPNCIGLAVPGIGLNATFSHRAPLKGDLAFVSQSGALVTGVIDWACSHDIGFSHIVSLGDMADADFGDLLDYLAGDTQSRAVLLYMESITKAPKFLSAARRAARVKPVVVVKAGRSAVGAKAALSHTGALASTDEAYAAAFRRAGLLRVRELDDLFSAAEILARDVRLTGDKLAILTNGGGAGVLVADHLAAAGGRFAGLSPETCRSLDAVLPPTWSRGNPVDIVGDADPERYAKALELLLGEDDADAVLVLNCPTALTSNIAIAQTVLDTIDQGKARGHSKPVLTTWLGDEVSRDARRMFAARGVPSFSTPAKAVDGFMQLVRHGRAQEALMRTPPAAPEDLDIDRSKASATIAQALDEGRSQLSEIEAKELLSAYGIHAVPTFAALTPEEVKDHAARLLTDNAACAVKILSEDISHKSDVGGVRLELEAAEDAQSAARDMLLRVRRLRPDARVQGFTVQPMVRRKAGYEVIVGMSVDATFGPVIMFGAGGTAVEVLRDTASALPPLDLNLADDLMRQTRIWHLLQGYRDRPPANLRRLAETLVRFSSLVASHAEIREIDINPLLVDESGVVALDARVRVVSERIEQRIAMAVRPYPLQWMSEATIDGIGAIRIRPIRPEDEHLYVEFFRHITAEDGRLRFFASAPSLSHRFIARLTQIDYAREMAFVAIARASGELLGVVRLIADPDYRRAEYAVLVRSDLKGRGLGWVLMQQLIAFARTEGLEELHGAVLAENTAMLSMCRELGFSIEPDADDSTLRLVTVRLQGGQ